MIHKLRKKFTVLATLSVFGFMAVLVCIMNLMNYSLVVSESDAVLDILLAPDIPFAEPEEKPNGPTDGFNPFSARDFFSPREMSPEVPYESRFFSATLNAEGEVINSDLSRIISVDSDSVLLYIKKTTSSSAERGFVGQFRYRKTEEGGLTRVLFLDCGRKLDSFRYFLFISLAVGLLGCLAVFVLFLFVSGRIVKPIAESYEKQKRFISDAGHEIKTPLTIIKANVDLLEGDGEKEELNEIRIQTERLTGLTKDLVYLSKMEESEQVIRKIECPLSDLVSETVNSFRAPAVAGHLELISSVEPNLNMTASPDGIRQLVSVLMENAVKYTPEGGTVEVKLVSQKKAVCLTVSNTASDTVSAADIPYLFDRFYRTDRSRNSETGGHGIGLSIAKAIAESHNGTISASVNNGMFRITVLLPN